MTLTDAGPLVALVNRNDPNHGKCVAATKRLPSGPLVTTWPCFTEAMYLLSRAGGYAAQAALWRLRAGGRLELLDLPAADVDRMAELMDKYRDRPMDLGDASLLAAAEHLGTRRVFTLDSDFHVYRLSDGSSFDIVP
ncbi:MAG: PIN domain-containing protein [Planctomycetes bacterium]|nr:PIN domain-containing protein [Planctomycetota bacterium]MBM4082472.1 PIN domain-containing protein [Planctomycetota bacterium]MBM4085153.1 PIN domain-containing protein [Planctomycetota bacterium]